MSRIGVTGAAGFIGSHLSEALVGAGHAVVGVDSFDPYYDRAIKERSVDALQSHPLFEFWEADICGAAGGATWLDEVDIVVHLAALAGVRASFLDPERYMAVNVGGTTALLDACRRVGVKRVVLASSSSVYGELGSSSLKETEVNLEPVSPYGVSKYAGELVSRLYVGSHGFRLAALRLFSVYGPRQRPDQAVFQFYAKLSAGEEFQFFGDGSSSRDYTHVNDVVRGIIAALGWVESAGPEYQVFNIGSARSVSLRELVEMLGRVAGVSPKIRRAPRPAGDVSRTYASIDKASAMLGYQPRVRLEDGLEEFNQWYEVTYGHQRSSVA